jgi:hypothetical protein
MEDTHCHPPSAAAPTARCPNAGWCRGVCAAGTRVGSLTRLSAEPRNEKAPRNPRGIATGLARLIRDVLSRADELTDADRRALSPLFCTHVNPYGQLGVRGGRWGCPVSSHCWSQPRRTVRDGRLPATEIRQVREDHSPACTTRSAIGPL